MSNFEDLLDMGHVEREPDYQVSGQGMRSIRRALTFGLHALAQVEYTLRARADDAAIGNPWPEGVATPVIAGDSFVETIKEMADALLWIEYANHVKEKPNGSASAD